MKWSSASVFHYLLLSCVQVVAAQTPFSDIVVTITSSSSTTSSGPTTTRRTTITSIDRTTTDSSTTSFSTLTIRSSDLIQVITSVFSPSSALPSKSSPAASPPPSSESGLSTGSIIGISIAVSVAVIGTVAFFVWRFARQRSRIDNNTHPFPTNSVGHPNTTATPFRSKALDGLSTPDRTSAVEDSRQRLAFQRSQDPLLSSVVSRLRPESRHTLRQVESLTREVEQLRTEMAGIRGEQQLQHRPHTTEEPPPDYDAES